MVDVRTVHAKSVQAFNAAYSEESAAYQRAAQQGDADEMSRAACSMAGLRASLKELNEMAREAMTPPAPPPGSDDFTHRDVALAAKYGLSPQEYSIAKGWTQDSNMSDEARVKTYAEQRARYQQMRRDGSYRDDQGVVRRP